MRCARARGGMETGVRRERAPRPARDETRRGEQPCLSSAAPGARSEKKSLFYRSYVDYV